MRLEKVTSIEQLKDYESKHKDVNDQVIDRPLVLLTDSMNMIVTNKWLITKNNYLFYNINEEESCCLDWYIDKSSHITEINILRVR